MTNRVAKLGEPSPVLSFYNYVSMPLAPQNISTMLEYVKSRLHLNLERVIIGLKHDRSIKKSLRQNLENLPNCQTEYFVCSNYEIGFSNFIWKQIDSKFFHSGTVVLISDGGEELTSLVKRIYYKGWRCVLVHSPLATKMRTDLLVHVAATIMLPIVKEKESSTSLRLYERRPRDSFKKKEIARWAPPQMTFFHWNVDQVNEEEVIEALLTRNEFPMTVTLALKNITEESSNGINEHFRKLPLSLLNQPEVSLSCKKSEKTSDDKILVRWKKDTVNHDKLAHCMQNVQQCPKWDNKIHSIFETSCKMFHPIEICSYYPRCRWTAESCSFAHPFCTKGPCRCESVKDTQKNHYIPEQ